MSERRVRAVVWRAVALSLALGGVFTPRSTLAASDFPTELKTIERLRFEGRHHVSRKDLVAVLKTRSPSIWPWSRPPTGRT